VAAEAGEVAEAEVVASHVVDELLDRVVPALRLFAQRHQHDVVQVACEFPFQAGWFLRTHLGDCVRRKHLSGSVLVQWNQLLLS
jgi:hypothetical protein